MYLLAYPNFTRLSERAAEPNTPNDAIVRNIPYNDRNGEVRFPSVGIFPGSEEWSREFLVPQPRPDW